MQDFEDVSEERERQLSYSEVIRYFGRRCPVPVTGDLASVAHELFERTLGKRVNGRWKHTHRWGRMLPGEDDQNAKPEPGPSEDDTSPAGQRRFRRHMRHLAMCMGREAERARRDLPDGVLTPGAFRAALVRVMVRSRTNDCRPLVAAADGEACLPVAVETLSPDLVYPKVCEEVVAEYLDTQPA